MRSFGIGTQTGGGSEIHPLQGPDGDTVEDLWVEPRHPILLNPGDQKLNVLKWPSAITVSAVLDSEISELGELHEISSPGDERILAIVQIFAGHYKTSQIEVETTGGRYLVEPTQEQ
ncbi:hypothetical protein [Streptomyces sp. SID12488]|uniref:hypothetical protein n=1 Tax=Streptomyces sp. SID12488 TaxID=2706040 RepID=UPI0013DC9CEA|nr:hypothetical protein [Streptomyces sp. SID12488]